MTYTKAKTYLFLILAAKVLLMTWVVLYAGINLMPDEAQYWTWSRALDWGYYSKPPGIAWQIWSSCLLFGNTELGIRFSAIVISFLLSLAIFHCGRACRLSPRASLIAALIMALSPLGIMGSFIATTDGGLVLFWTLACAAMARSLYEGRPPNYFLVGFWIVCGALFKWPIYFLWLFILVFISCYRRYYTHRFWGGVVLSFCGVLPSLVWNLGHEGATFRHVAATIEGGGKLAESAFPMFNGNLLEFIGAQAALVSPILFVLLVMAFIHLLRNRSGINSSLLFCGYLCLTILLCCTAFSVFKKMQGNWGVYAYPSGVVLLGWYLGDRVAWGKKWAAAGIALSLLLAGLTLSIPYLQSQGIPDCCPIPYKINPFRHGLGWSELQKGLDQIGYDKEKHFLFGDRYQTTSILSFYNTGQKRAYFLNLGKIRKNQFSYWPGMAQEQLGKTGYFVWVENAPGFDKALLIQLEYYSRTLGEYFDAVEIVSVLPLFQANGDRAKGAVIFRCSRYNGRLPEDTLLY